MPKIEVKFIESDRLGVSLLAGDSISEVQELKIVKSLARDLINCIDNLLKNNNIIDVTDLELKISQNQVDKNSISCRIVEAVLKGMAF
ncbi:MAG: hypothetical protein COV31_00730 [Candidatus Yanofskybacteria bacterium CG10_big_fil_rev_8_21_14_0_10_46_23]|uniref:Uncharacterized protein n=1 Tax=Candidatus Yanofskybacteria bacterium CG10_big_fil_rev_8_21_14_0_10_46_23 TaxID=1975098 RepID=A0A2H0R531_9BACT|nr:MAG: hypothetical protein COV31_00730 [Candidatus Yanofskybacteria bacterium CG10_big_fil_rev_8_21_14_0_10_46_23]